ncbi:hypothetical protein HN385_03355 [archaeon]|jgi:hypothetical protein|nr:hypothetical protein [archaeon]MBT3451483.1 hypothetical protein [archaeon]MBT6869733.1 hypothetical protein [archaeon]MBT7192688.1 hypothetical protein [archaeon]MBT7380713.1 hypothetical protein [archaeon]
MGKKVNLESIVKTLRADIKVNYNLMEVLFGKRRKALKQYDRLMNLYEGEENKIVNFISAFSSYVDYNELLPLFEISYQQSYQDSMFNIFCAMAFPGITKQDKKWYLGIMYEKRENLDDLIPLLNHLIKFNPDIGNIQINLPTDVKYLISYYVGGNDHEYFIPLMNGCLDLGLFNCTAEMIDGIGNYEIKSKNYIRKSKFHKMIDFSKKYINLPDFNNTNFVYYSHYILRHLHNYVDEELSGNLSNKEINNLSKAYQLALGYATKGVNDDYTKGFMNQLFIDSLQELNNLNSIDEKRKTLNEWSLNVSRLVRNGDYELFNLMMGLNLNGI